ncbi:hypothetical protein SLE2022_228620 [Rubroshorea leprosula]
MAKVYHAEVAGPLEAPCSMSSESKTFTIWMKSLVYHANGCTVFDSKGEIVYRVDNYDSKCSSEVFLMDRQGKVLCTIQRKRLRIFGRWDGYRLDTKKPWFQVRKCSRVLTVDLACEVTIGHCKYWIVSLAHKASFQIVDIDGDVVAEVKQKQVCSGIMLGDDVLSLEMKPHFDHSLIMALVTVNGLINGKM